ncbi:MAG: PEGA domain-containing protein [Deltaproteobacteria bacterium]|nr:PEGA domain-containing protein [Deltaproteobacteria bacterium]
MIPVRFQFYVGLVAIAILFSIASAAAPQQVDTGILNIDSIPSGAEVYVDERLRGTTPIMLEVQAIPHTIHIQQKGYQTHTANITVKKNKVIRTNFKLKKLPKAKAVSKKQHAPAQPQAVLAEDGTETNGIRLKEGIRIHNAETKKEPGTVFLDTTPQSLTASINGYRISKTTPVAFDIRPGIYELKLFNEKQEIVYKKTIFVRSGKTLSLDIVIQKKRTIDYTDPWK